MTVSACRMARRFLCSNVTSASESAISALASVVTLKAADGLSIQPAEDNPREIGAKQTTAFHVDVHLSAESARKCDAQLQLSDRDEADVQMVHGESAPVRVISQAAGAAKTLAA